jgi:hypothetical protein
MADATFAIDIAAKMSGGGQTLAQLDELTRELLGGGKNAEFFQQAIQQVGQQLSQAQAATAASNAALKAGEEEYSRLERAALQVSKAAEKAARANAGVMPPEAAAFVAAGTAALAAQAAELKKLEASAKGASAEEARLAQQAKNLDSLNGHVNKTLAGQAEGLEKVRFGLSSAGGPLGQLASKALAPVQGFAKLSAEFGNTKALALVAGAGLAALAVAAVALAVAITVATVKFAAWAVGLADSARNTRLASEAMHAMHPELAALDGTIASVARETGLHADELQALTGRLKEANVAASDMPAALRAAALAEAALGKGGAEEFVKQIKAGDVAVSKLAATTSAKLGGIVARQMLGLDAQSKRLHENIGEIFGGLNIDPLLGGLQTLVALFDSSSVAGKALKFLFETMFQPLINHAQEAAYVVEAFYLGVLIGAVKMYIAIKPAIKAVSELLGFNDTSLTDALSFAKKAGELLFPVFAVLAVGVGLFTAAIAAVLGIALALPAILIAPFVLLASVAANAGTAIANGILGAIQFLKSIDLGQVGRDLMMGLVNGITGSAGAVLNAIGGAVKGAISSAKSLLGIASPSKVFAELGGYTVEGFAGGVEDGAPDAQAAMAAVVSPPAAGGGLAAFSSPSDSAAPAAKGGGGGGATVDLSGSVWNISGVKDAEDLESRIGEIWTRIVEGDALSLGAPVPG